ncbi:MAG: bacteriohopanetetrol glucosamine biosynthesis glycosyltransferase HpnI [Acidobacteriia bacterium]|nr:bacteriohopanetetrol glucosamine biosynthesis glycosyltransferase HpnI [Terriglobia bacterium]
MFLTILKWAILVTAAMPSLYYLAVILSARRFFSRHDSAPGDFTPPVSILKPVQGLEPEAYENFSSFCRQDYPEYEILFGVSSERDPVVPEIRKLIADFPRLSIRLVVVAERCGSNDKVSKLCGLARAAKHSVLVVSDADIRVGPGYLRSVAAPFREARVGAVTSLYTGIAPRCLWSKLEAINLSSDFMASVLVARQLEGVRFALGATMAVRRECLAEIGGFEALADVAADDHALGSRIAARGHRVELVNGAVQTMCPVQSLREFFDHHLRWGMIAHQSRPLGYLGYGATLGLPWTLLAAILAPTRLCALSFVAAYLMLRAAVAWTVGVRGLRDSRLKRRWWLVPLWDAFSFIIWLGSHFRNRVRWRGAEYYMTGGRLIPAVSPKDIPSGSTARGEGTAAP